jgi:uncharacterized OB-fold protein
MADAASAAAGPRPVVPWLVLGPGDPYLEGQRCERCGAIYLGARSHCGRCFAREAFAPVRLANRGVLHAYSIVHRCFPGIAVPYVSAIVDLDGGGTVKGNLIEVEPDPAQIRLGMAVEVVYRDALGRRDKAGNSYLSYFFRPAR